MRIFDWPVVEASTEHRCHQARTMDKAEAAMLADGWERAEE
jgi:hypothetical protein